MPHGEGMTIMGGNREDKTSVHRGRRDKPQDSADPTPVLAAWPVHLDFLSRAP